MLYAIIAAVVLVVLIFLYMLSRVVVVPSNLTGLVAGSTRNGEIKIIRPGGRDFVLPIIQSIQYLPFTQNTIGFQVTAEDENKINVNVSAVAAVKVGDGAWHLVAGLEAAQYAEGMRRRVAAAVS